MRRLALPHERAAVRDLGQVDAPAPRAAFVADLESRLTDLMVSSARGDLLPEIELAPYARRPRSPVTVTATAAVMCMTILAFVVVGAIRSPRADSEIHTTPAAVDGQIEDGALTPASNGSSDGGGGAGGLHERDDRGSVPAAGGTGAVAVAEARRVPPAASATPAPHEHDETVVQRSLALRVSGTPARVFLNWERYDLPDFAAYLVLRANDPDIPAHPDESGRTVILRRIEARDSNSYADTPKVATSPRYRVVVLDAAGRVLASSAAVEPTSALPNSSVKISPLST